MSGRFSVRLEFIFSVKAIDLWVDLLWRQGKGSFMGTHSLILLDLLRWGLLCLGLKRRVASDGQF